MRTQCAQQLAAATERASQLTVFAGLDGFVDEIIHVVDKRDSAEVFQRVPSILRLGDRIKAAQPMEPDSAAAQGFVDEWFALLKPFADVASPEMWKGSMKLYDNMDSWARQGEGQADPGFDKQVWDFMKLATASRLTAGGKIETLPSGKEG